MLPKYISFIFLEYVYILRKSMAPSCLFVELCSLSFGDIKRDDMQTGMLYIIAFYDEQVELSCIDEEVWCIENKHWSRSLKRLLGFIARPALAVAASKVPAVSLFPIESKRGKIILRAFNLNPILRSFAPTCVLACGKAGNTQPQWLLKMGKIVPRGIRTHLPIAVVNIQKSEDFIKKIKQTEAYPN